MCIIIIHYNGVKSNRENNIYYIGENPMSEIDHIVENELDVVLVDCMVWNKKTKEFEHQYRWFEVPEDFEEESDKVDIERIDNLFDEENRTQFYTNKEDCVF